MQDAPDLRRAIGKTFLCAHSRELANSDNPLGFERGQDGTQVLVARAEESSLFGAGKFVGRAIGSALFQERERAVVEDEVRFEKLVGRSEALREEFPESLTADLCSRAGEAGDEPLRVFGRRFSDRGFDAQPVAHGRDLAEGHAGLRHAERAGIHAEKDDALPRGAIFSDVNFVRGPCVIERVVNVRDRRGKLQAIHSVPQFRRGLQDAIGYLRSS